MKTASAARFKQAEFEIIHYMLTVEEGTSIDDLKKPEFWADIAMLLRPWYIVHVRPDDGSWYAQMIVRDAGHLWAKMALISFVEFSDAKAPESVTVIDGHEIKYRGPHHKWSVVRKSDQGVIKEAIGTKVEAFAWLAEYLKTVAA